MPSVRYLIAVRRRLTFAIVVACTAGCESAIEEPATTATPAVDSRQIQAVDHLCLMASNCNLRECDPSAIHYYVNGVPVGDGAAGFAACAAALEQTRCKSAYLVFPVNAWELGGGNPIPRFSAFEAHDGHDLWAVAHRRGIRLADLMLERARDTTVYRDLNGRVVTAGE